jgi:CubicO group peptidase (beta-lactamase class C family)
MIRSASFAALCAAALACSRVSGATETAPPLPSPTASAIETHWRESGMPGLCAVTFDTDGVTGAVALGFRDVATRSPYRLDTVQSVGSISKTTVGYALALLNTRGLLDLDAPIDAWLPYTVRNPRHAAAPITARQLATHTAGVLDRPAAYRRAYQRTATPTISMADFVRQYFEPSGQLYSPSNFGTEAPGLQFQYSNMGAALAATMVERRTGQAFSEYSQAQIFAPLGMTDTTWEQRPGPNSATPHKANGKAWPSYSLVTYADGALRSSCRDLARYGTALLRAARGEPAGLDAQSVQLMLAGQFDPGRLPRGVDTSEPNQGLFWQHRRSGGIGHSGSDPGISAFLLLQPDQRRGQLLLTNCGLDESKRFETGFGRIWSLLRGTEPPQR